MSKRARSDSESDGKGDDSPDPDQIPSSTANKPAKKLKTATGSVPVHKTTSQDVTNVSQPSSAKGDIVEGESLSMVIRPGSPPVPEPEEDRTRQLQRSDLGPSRAKTLATKIFGYWFNT